MVVSDFCAGVDQDESILGDAHVIAHVVQHASVLSAADDRVEARPGRSGFSKGAVDHCFDYPFANPVLDPRRSHTVAVGCDMARGSER